MSNRDRVLSVAGRLAVGLHRACGDRSRGRLGILVHHCVSPPLRGADSRPYSVTPEVFRRQISELLDRGYCFVRLSEALAARRTGRRLPRRAIVLTFDDAYQSVYCHAFDVLRQLRVPAAVFLATAYLDSSDPFPFDDWSCRHAGSMPPQEYRPLTTAQCREMAASGLVELGAHTHTHQDFRGRAEDFGRDLRHSRDVLEQLFQLREVPFAFPYGRAHLGFCGGALTDQARAAGVTCGLTTDCALVDPLEDDPFAWGRFNCYQSDTAATIAAKLAGWFDWPHRAQAWLDRMRGKTRGHGPRTAEPVDEASALPAVDFSQTPALVGNCRDD